MATTRSPLNPFGGPNDQLFVNTATGQVISAPDRQSLPLAQSADETMTGYWQPIGANTLANSGGGAGGGAGGVGGIPSIPGISGNYIASYGAGGSGMGGLGGATGGFGTPELQAAFAYTQANRPNAQLFAPNGQFYQPIYQPSYTNYNPNWTPPTQAPVLNPVALAGGIPSLLAAMRGGAIPATQAQGQPGGIMSLLSSYYNPAPQLAPAPVQAQTPAPQPQAQPMQQNQQWGGGRGGSRGWGR